ncbi:ABC transporter ATP-binding protein [Actinoplanes sp. NEAU-A12]|uniref:ABC transporter ATP-binding protein n=1 Tax=Actinoplanes sandaracinus TaxID=3045177 RepID=A0ABT6WKN6_9ACTN|nr:ABC transporter ATP-binding protein [Actinoplanes sandaracinus]MDI6100284.1 ABC transporter ATP-binding protein [Actinoplanes sandaracinus]
MKAITCQGVRFTYGRSEVVCGVDLEVGQGELLALLGTNGAGKTTTLEVLLGQRRPAGGRVRLLGRDPFAERRRLAAEVGVVPQESGLAPDLTVAETVRLWLRLHRRDRVGPVSAELLGELDLEHRAAVRVRQLSGGERRRLDLAVALCGVPRLLVLDEPSTGLDPESRQRTWALLRERRRQGTTILLTTHFFEEAEALADRVVIMDRGRVAFTGTVADAGGPGALAAAFHRIAGGPPLSPDATEQSR